MYWITLNIWYNCSNLLSIGKSHSEESQDMTSQIGICYFFYSSNSNQALFLLNSWDLFTLLKEAPNACKKVNGIKKKIILFILEPKFIYISKYLLKISVDT